MRRKTGHVDLFPIGYEQCAIAFDKVSTFQQLSTRASLDPKKWGDGRHAILVICSLGGSCPKSVTGRGVSKYGIPEY